MNARHDLCARWSTSSFGSAADTSPAESAMLGEHLRRCDASRGTLFSLRIAGDSLGRFVEPRLVTVAVLFGLLSIVASLVL